MNLGSTPQPLASLHRHLSSQPEASLDRPSTLPAQFEVTLQAFSMPPGLLRSPLDRAPIFRRFRHFLFSLHFELLALYGLVRFLPVIGVQCILGVFLLRWCRMCRSSVCFMCSSRSAFGFSQVFLFFSCLRLAMLLSCLLLALLLSYLLLASLFRFVSSFLPCCWACSFGSPELLTY